MGGIIKDFIIPVYIKGENELYSEFDPAGQALSSSLREYLSDCLEDRGFMENVILVLHSPELLDMNRFKNAYVAFLEKLISRNKKEMIKYKTDSFRLLIIGVVFIANGILLNGHIDQVFSVIISTIGSFSVWEASAVWIKMLPSLRKRGLLFKKLSKAEIRYNAELI